MTSSLARPRTVHPVVKSLAYLGLAAVVLWIGFNPPDRDPDTDPQAVLASVDSSLAAAKATMGLVEENSRLTRLILDTKGSVDPDSLRRIQETLRTNQVALERRVAELRREQEASDRQTASKARAQLSALRKQRWFAGIAGVLFLFLAGQSWMAWRQAPRPAGTRG